METQYLVAAVITNAILGGLWRRWLGGWGADRRSLILLASLALLWPLAFSNLPWWTAAIVAPGLLLFWAMGHRFDKWGIVLRYPLFGIAYPIFGKLGLRDWTVWAEVVIGAGIYGTLTFLALTL